MLNVLLDVYWSNITLDTFSIGLWSLTPSGSLFLWFFEWIKALNLISEHHRVQHSFHRVERQSTLIMPSSIVKKKKSGRHFHALFFLSLSISVSLARLNLYEGTLIKRIYGEEQQCEIEPFLLNLDEKLWQLFIFVSGLPQPSLFFSSPSVFLSSWSLQWSLFLLLYFFLLSPASLI